MLKWLCIRAPFLFLFTSIFTTNKSERDFCHDDSPPPRTSPWRSLFTPALFAQAPLASIPVGSHPQAIAVNAFTDRIYTIDEPSDQITEIDGVTDVATSIPLGVNAQQSLNGQLAINPFTNKIYAVDGVNNHLNIIDGPTRALTQIPTGASPYAIALNPYTNKIYVANFNDGTKTIVDGATLINSDNKGWHSPGFRCRRLDQKQDLRGRQRKKYRDHN